MSTLYVQTGSSKSLLRVEGSNESRTHRPTRHQILALGRAWLGEAPVIKGVVVPDDNSPIADQDFAPWADEALAWSGSMFIVGRESWPQQ